MPLRLIVRNAAEFVAIIVLWRLLLTTISSSGIAPFWLTILLLAMALVKTIFFGGENLRQLWMASVENMAYHRFMTLMLVNMSQIIISFGFDYHCLHRINAGSFSSVPEHLSGAELVFEFVYFSILNFTFFGYGDMTPATVPAKLLTVTEVILAFVTVIFLLSDFVSLRESLSPHRKPDASE